jgi:hypothetical protein
VPGNGNNNGEESVAGFIMGPLHQKSSNISALKKMPNSTKVTPKKVILVSKSDFAFLVFAPRALENRSTSYTYSHPNDEKEYCKPQLQPR